ncbi:hypothetical protein NEUTE1DRAFT_125568 [Neurospora tetrasperma FGSC 2508]|uniref:Uncharacterized protein n=1 Tax=Neurospora tetrasperma (strain FGSC 2508 / ATCC MYA-4615 / P0657) TaxID=510951 RepID=F8MYY2_NEUT8|nr:uncharacterized protein NEUTE1DRAFT_125568 [Neurospora tetrasperma FGSC 2508]EGO51980.1 hypothetical protein NEUTE1DRAFT_125568 [Neurospora tetrasperma FGSC 2508]
MMAGSYIPHDNGLGEMPTSQVHPNDALQAWDTQNLVTSPWTQPGMSVPMPVVTEGVPFNAWENQQTPTGTPRWGGHDPNASMFAADWSVASVTPSHEPYPHGGDYFGTAAITHSMSPEESMSYPNASAGWETGSQPALSPYTEFPDFAALRRSESAEIKIEPSNQRLVPLMQKSSVNEPASPGGQARRAGKLNLMPTGPHHRKVKSTSKIGKPDSKPKLAAASALNTAVLQSQMKRKHPGPIPNFPGRPNIMQTMQTHTPGVSGPVAWMADYQVHARNAYSTPTTPIGGLGAQPITPMGIPMGMGNGMSNVMGNEMPNGMADNGMGMGMNMGMPVPNMHGGMSMGMGSAGMVMTSGMASPAPLPIPSPYMQQPPQQPMAGDPGVGMGMRVPGTPGGRGQHRPSNTMATIAMSQDPRAAAEQIRKDAWQVCERERVEMLQRRLMLTEHERGMLDQETNMLQLNLGKMRQVVARHHQELEEAVERARKLNEGSSSPPQEGQHDEDEEEVAGLPQTQG